MRQRGSSVAAFGVTVLVAAALYASVVTGMVRQWFDDSTSSHGILLAGAAAYLVHRAWPSLRTRSVAPHDSGYLLIAFALLIYIIGSLTGDVFVLRGSIPILIAGTIVALWGFAHLRVMIAPLALLTLAIPLPSVLVTDLTLPLQLIASRVAAVTLAASGIPVVRDGNLLTLPNITLEVAEACNGLRSVISLISVAAVCAAIIPLDRRRAAFTIAAAVPVAVVGNGLRVAATGWLATWFGEAAVRGVVHEVTGFIAFIGMCAATLILLALTRGRHLRWVRPIL